MSAGSTRERKPQELLLLLLLCARDHPSWKKGEKRVAVCAHPTANGTSTALKRTRINSTKSHVCLIRPCGWRYHLRQTVRSRECRGTPSFSSPLRIATRQAVRQRRFSQAAAICSRVIAGRGKEAQHLGGLTSMKASGWEPLAPQPRPRVQKPRVAPRAEVLHRVVQRAGLAAVGRVDLLKGEAEVLALPIGKHDVPNDSPQAERDRAGRLRLVFGDPRRDLREEFLREAARDPFARVLPAAAAACLLQQSTTTEGGRLAVVPGESTGGLRLGSGWRLGAPFRQDGVHHLAEPVVGAEQRHFSI